MKPIVLKIFTVIIILGIIFFIWKIYSHKKIGIPVPSVPVTTNNPIIGKPVETLDGQIIQESIFNDSNYVSSDSDFSEPVAPSKKEITDKDIPSAISEFK